MVSQFAGSLMLLLITGVFVLGFQKTAGLEVGFDSRDLYLISVDPVRDGCYVPARRSLRIDPAAALPQE